MENEADSPKRKNTKTVRVEPDDLFLNIIVGFAESGVANLPVTLLVKGLLVSGFVISEADYLKQFASGAVNDVIENAVKTGRIKLPESSEGEDAEERVEHIHLKDAQVFSGSHLPIPSNGGILWRGRISSIDGYWIGNLSARVSSVDEFRRG